MRESINLKANKRWKGTPSKGNKHRRGQRHEIAQGIQVRANYLA